jgi:hypothetical protein
LCCLCHGAEAILFSDGSERVGTIRFAAPLRLHDGRGSRSLDPQQVAAITWRATSETMEAPFRFAEPGKPAKETTGPPRPVRHLAATVTMADGGQVTGTLTTTVAYVTDAQGTAKVVLASQQTGQAGQTLADLVYPLRLVRDTAHAAAAAQRVELPLTMQACAILPLPDLGRIGVRQQAGVWRLDARAQPPCIVAGLADDGIHIAWPSEDPALRTRLEPLLAEVRDFLDERRLLSAATIDGAPCALLLLRRAGVSTSTHPWRVEVWRWLLAEGATPQVAARGYLLRGIDAPPAVHLHPAWWPLRLDQEVLRAP